MRNALSDTLYRLAADDPRLCVLVADISPAGSMEKFRAEFPERFINVGVAEQSMIGLAAGMAQRGLRPFCYTIATFALFRPYEFIRCDLAYQDLPVTVVGMGAGLSYSTLGGTHQAIEDVAVALACPNMTVLAPCDPCETLEMVEWCARRDSGGPVYLRLGKAGELGLTEGQEPWEFGALRWLKQGKSKFGDCVLSYGPIASEAWRLAELIGAACCTVPTLRPLAVERLRDLESYSRLIVVEEAAGAPLAHLLWCQLSGTAKELCSFKLPREFCHQLGSRWDLLKYYGLTAEQMMERLCRRE